MLYIYFNVNRGQPKTIGKGGKGQENRPVDLQTGASAVLPKKTILYGLIRFNHKVSAGLNWQIVVRNPTDSHHFIFAG